MSETPETDAPAKREESGVDPYCRLLARSRKIERERDLLRRQVEVLVGLVANNWCSGCPCRRTCGRYRTTPECKAKLTAWSLEQAKKGGGGE